VIAFMLNLVLAIIWSLLMGSIDLPNLVVGFLLGYAVLWIAQPVLGGTGYFRRVPRSARFIGYFTKEIVVSNLLVAREVLSPRPRRRPAVIAVPLDARTDTEITLLADVVTLTPGSVSLDVSDDRSTLYVHTMFLDSPEALREEIKNGFERRILELLR
jgi:multicomponent Na+:H+ antiporter subunit E